jgi:hypothetical protein
MLIIICLAFVLVLMISYFYVTIVETILKLKMCPYEMGGPTLHCLVNLLTLGHFFGLQVTQNVNFVKDKAASNTE